MKNPRHSLLVAVRELWSLFPHWQFGKLLDNLAIWAKGPACPGVEATFDTELLAAAEEQISNRRVSSVDSQPLTWIQQQALLAFEKFVIEHPELTVGESLKKVAMEIPIRTYDLSDEDLIRAVRNCANAISI